MLIEFLPYVFQLLVLCVLVVLLKRQAEYPVLIFLILFNGLRLGIGNDYDQYRNIFEHVANNLDAGSLEPGFFLVAKIIAVAFGVNGYPLLFLFYSSVTYFFLVKAIFRLPEYQWSLVSIPLSGFTYYANNQIRQATATAVFYAYFVRGDRGRPFFIWICLACAFLFHFSALVLLLALFVPRRPISRVWASIGVLVCAAIYQWRLVGFFARELVKAIPYYGSIYADRFSGFTGTTGEGSGLAIVFWLLLALFLIWFTRNESKAYILNLFTFGTALNFLFLGWDLFERVSYYFIYLKIFLLGEYLFNSSRRVSSLAAAGFLFFLLVLYFLTEGYLGRNKHGILPFQHLLLGAGGP